MTKQELREAIRAIIRKELAENTTTAPSEPGTKERPGTAQPTKPDKGRKIGKDPKVLPQIAPKADVKKLRATMTEADMVAKIIKKYRNLKNNG